MGSIRIAAQILSIETKRGKFLTRLRTIAACLPCGVFAASKPMNPALEGWNADENDGANDGNTDSLLSHSRAHSLFNSHTHSLTEEREEVFSD